MCKQSLDAPEELANQLIECPTCAQTIEVPLCSSSAHTDPLPPPIPPQPTLRPPPVHSSVVPSPGRHGIFYYVFWGTLSLFATLAILFVGFLFLTAAGGAFLSGLAGHTAARSEKTSHNSSAPVVRLRLGKWNWHKSSSSHVTAEGEITNISSESLKNVEAVVTFRTKSGDFITSDSAIIDYNPLLPNQTSPWKVIATWNPEMQTASVQFKTLWGRTLRVENEK